MSASPGSPFPIPAVRLIARNPERQVLLLRRASRVGHGQWCLPGGKVDHGQLVEDAATRELTEETRLDAVGLRFLFYQDSLPLAPGGMHCIDFYFECDTRGELRLNHESSEYAWIGPEELERYSVLFRNDEALRRYWSTGDHG